MINPNIPNIPGMGAMTDTLDFVKNLWGSMGLPGMSVPGMSAMNVPGMVMPTLSVDEINKRISDLKAVESWLSLNMGMLRSTIQALEVQAATISTLQTMGERFSATMNPGAHESGRQTSGRQTGASSNGASASNGADGGITAERDHGTAPEPTKKDEQDAASLTAPLVNAAAWWNMLQDQFKQAVNTAMTETQAVAAAATAPAAAPPKAKASSSKPKASSSSSSASSSASAAPRKRKTSK